MIISNTQCITSETLKRGNQWYQQQYGEMSLYSYKPRSNVQVSIEWRKI